MHASQSIKRYTFTETYISWHFVWIVAWLLGFQEWREQLYNLQVGFSYKYTYISYHNF